LKFKALKTIKILDVRFPTSVGKHGSDVECSKSWFLNIEYANDIKIEF